MILLVDAPERVMQARLCGDLLRTELARCEKLHVSDVIVRVSPRIARSEPSDRPVRRARPISPSSAEILAATARSIDDPRLAEALMRLAAQVRSREPGAGS